MGFFDKLKKKPEQRKAEQNVDWTNPEDVKKHVIVSLYEVMKEQFPEIQQTQDGVFFAKWNVSVRPEVAQLAERGIVLDLYIDAPQWDRNLYECTVGMGNDQMTNVGMALASFVFAFMQGIANMEERQGGLELTSSFGGKTHKWKAYKTDIVGVGRRRNDEVDTDVYWNALKDDILKRLGNQKLCYVKIFGSKMQNDVTGEVRINDIKSNELSDKVAAMVAKWNVDGFVSQKQFFFIRQEEDTYLPYPYEGSAGMQKIREMLVPAAKLFLESATDDALYDSIPERLSEIIGDKVFAWECFSFLPEMCTENAFPDVKFPEMFSISIADHIEHVYASQLADYDRMKQALFGLFSDGTFGDQTNKIYQTMISCSATAASISQALQKDCKPNGLMTAIVYSADENFVLR